MMTTINVFRSGLAFVAAVIGCVSAISYADKFFICSACPAAYADAIGYLALGQKAFGSPGGAFGPIGAGSPSGRAVSSTAVVDGVLTANGTASYLAVVDSANSRLLMTQPFVAPRTTQIGVPFVLPPFDVTRPSSDNGSAPPTPGGMELIDRVLVVYNSARIFWTATCIFWTAIYVFVLWDRNQSV
jgi:hypothetical protein